MVVSYGRCCHPIPGDPIMGYLSAGRGVVIHRNVCGNLGEFRKQPHKWIAVNWETVIGNHNYIMAYAHIAHDCYLGDRIIMSNVATLGGHITVGDHAILGAMVAVHQFTRIGAYAFLGAKSGVDRDVPPFMITAMPRAKLYGINQRGLRRLGFAPETIEGLKKAYRIIWRDNKTFSEGIKQVREEIESFPELEVLLGFLDGSKRGILR